MNVAKRVGSKLIAFLYSKNSFLKNTMIPLQWHQKMMKYSRINQKLGTNMYEESFKMVIRKNFRLDKMEKKFFRQETLGL